MIAWVKERAVTTVAIGDPAGITDEDYGRAHNHRLRRWCRTHLIACLKDKALRAGIAVVTVDERATSSTCPECGARVPEPAGRRFGCPCRGFTGHRDVVGARNIAAKGGGTTSAGALVTHRRAGLVPARRDRRRHLYDLRRSCLAPGPPIRTGCRSPGTTPARIS